MRTGPWSGIPIPADDSTSARGQQTVHVRRVVADVHRAGQVFRHRLGNPHGLKVGTRLRDVHVGDRGRIFPRFCRHVVGSRCPCFIVDGRRVADPGVQPHAIVVGNVAPPSCTSSAGCTKRRPWTASLFIEWKNDSMCALSVISRGRFMLCTRSQGRQPIAEGIGGISTPVAVEDDTRAWAPMGDGVVERRQRQTRVLAGPETPAENAPR